MATGGDAAKIASSVTCQDCAEALTLFGQGPFLGCIMVKQIGLLVLGCTLCVSASATANATVVVQSGNSVPDAYGQVQLSSYGTQIYLPAQTVSDTAPDYSSSATVSLTNNAAPFIQGPYVSAEANNPNQSTTTIFHAPPLKIPSQTATPAEVEKYRTKRNKMWATKVNKQRG